MMAEYYYYGVDIIRIFIALLIVLPVFSVFAGIIWKVANLSNRVERNSGDLDNLGKKIRELDEQHTTALQKLMEEINKFGNTLTAVTTSMDYIEKNLSELNACVKRLHRKRSEIKTTRKTN